jgi:DUF971 family protein
LTAEPVKIRITGGNELVVEWSDSAVTKIPLLDLRKKCPCATCVAEKTRQSAKYIPLFMRDQVTVKELKPVGSYALNVVWQDGHSTGIYEYSTLRLMNPE